MTQSYRFEGLITLLSPLSHAEGTIGNESKIRKEQIIQEDGSIENCFVYSGNAVRGVMRDMGMKYFLDKLSIAQIPLDIFYLLFSGGSLESTLKGMDVSHLRNYKKVVPLLSVFGGAIGNQIMDGKLRVGKAYPVCVETKRLLPQYLQENATESWRRYRYTEEYSRTDDAKSEALRPYIDWHEKDQPAGGPQQMRYGVEVMAAGLTLYHWFELDGVTEVELGAFCSALERFSKSPTLGGKAGIGLGRVSLNYDRFKINESVEFDEELQVAKEEYDAALSDFQLALQEHKGDAVKLLGATLHEE